MLLSCLGFWFLINTGKQECQEVLLSPPPGSLPSGRSQEPLGVPITVCATS